jgi:hypothetical protein
MVLPPTKRPPPIITHAPRGLEGGRPPHDARRLRSIAVTIGLAGAAALFGAVLEEVIFDPCRNADPGDWNTSGNRCGASHSGSGSGSRSGSSHFFYGGGGQHSATFGGFGATGESGAHGGGFGGHGGGE